MLPPEMASRVSLKTFWAAPWASVGTAAMEKIEVDRLADVIGRFFDGLGRRVLGGSGGGLLGRSGGLTAGAERKQHDECEEHGDEFLHFFSSF